MGLIFDNWSQGYDWSAARSRKWYSENLSADNTYLWIGCKAYWRSVHVIGEVWMGLQWYKSTKKRKALRSLIVRLQYPNVNKFKGAATSIFSNGLSYCFKDLTEKVTKIVSVQISEKCQTTFTSWLDRLQRRTRIKIQSEAHKRWGASVPTWTECNVLAFTDYLP